MFVFLGSAIDGALWWSMVRLHMILQLTTDTKLSKTMTTNVRPVHPTAAVTMHVFPQMLGTCEGFWTRRAGVRLVAVVQFDVTAKVPDACKQYATDSTSELHHSIDVTDVIRLRVFHVGRFDCGTEARQIHR